MTWIYYLKRNFKTWRCFEFINLVRKIFEFCVIMAWVRILCYHRLELSTFPFSTFVKKNWSPWQVSNPHKISHEFLTVFKLVCGKHRPSKQSMNIFEYTPSEISNSIDVMYSTISISKYLITVVYYEWFIKKGTVKCRPQVTWNSLVVFIAQIGCHIRLRFCYSWINVAIAYFHFKWVVHFVATHLPEVIIFCLSKLQIAFL